MDTKYQEIKEENLGEKETSIDASKLPCTTNEIFHKIFCSIEEAINKRITDWSIGNGYYLFDFGENTVCHFRVPGAKKWLFGIWAIPQEDGSIRVDLFGEHEWYIDKFKPTATKLSDSAVVKDQASLDDLDWSLVSIILDIASIAKYPTTARFVHYWNGNGWPVAWLWHQWVFYTICLPWRNFLEDRGNKWLGTIYKYWFRFRYGRKARVELIDENTENFTAYPRWNLAITYPAGSSEEYILPIYAKVSKWKFFGGNGQVYHYEEGDKRSFFLRVD